jgi:hypothetical protein
MQHTMKIQAEYTFLGHAGPQQPIFWPESTFCSSIDSELRHNIGRNAGAQENASHVPKLDK